jgi:hypothetical protein
MSDLIPDKREAQKKMQQIISYIERNIPRSERQAFIQALAYESVLILDVTGIIEAQSLMEKIKKHRKL